MHKRSLRATVILASLLLGAAAAAKDQVRQVSSAVPKYRLVFLDNALSAEFSDAPLGEILAELSRQSGISVYFSGAGAAEKITARFENIPLEQAIQRMLGGNYTLRYDSAGDPSHNSQASPRVAEIRVLSRGQGPVTEGARQWQSPTPAPVVPAAASQAPNDGALEQWLQQAQGAGPPDERIAALRAIADLDSPERGLPAFEAALRDGDPRVRDAAMQLVEEKGLAVPVKTLHNLALEDDNPALRIRALGQIAEKSDPRIAAGYLAQAMTQEQDPDVKGRARQLLQELLNKNNSRQVSAKPKNKP